MKQSAAGILIPALLAAVGIALIVAWAGTGSLAPLEARVPGLDEVPPALPSRTLPRPVPGEPVRSDGRPSKIAAMWPWFRGPDGDAIGKEKVRLARSWPSAGPKRLWTVTLGEGYAAAAVRDGCVYVLDHVQDASVTMLRNLSEEDRNRLAEALTPLSVGELDRADGLLHQLFSPSDVSETQFAELKRSLGQLLSEHREKFLRSLRAGSLDDVDRSADTMRCLSLDDGREIWRNGYSAIVPPHHGSSRTIPAVIDHKVLSLGPLCQAVCWDADSGKAHWLIDLVLDYGATVPPWYNGQCPMVDTKTDRLILASGGKALLVAVDYRTGKVVWASPNPRAWTMTHVSVVPMEFAGRRMYVYCGKGGVAGVAADTGELLWDTTDWQIGTATCPTPVVVGDGRIFFSGGYGAGSLMLQLSQEQGRIVPHTEFRLSAKQFGSEQQTPILYDGHLYGVRQKDQQLVCLDLQGKELWNSGRDKFGSAPYMIADGLIYAMNDEGVLTMAEATSAGYKRLARATVIDDGVYRLGPDGLGRWPFDRARPDSNDVRGCSRTLGAAGK